MSTNSIQLPYPPLAVPAGQDAYVNEPVTLHFRTGGSRDADLVSFVADQETLSVRTGTGSDVMIEDIAQGDLNYLHLKRPRAMVRTLNAMTKRGKVILPPDKQEFEIAFHNGATLTGETYGFRLVQAGLHLFPAQQKDEFTHLFAPAPAIRNYRIGPPLGQALIKQKLASAADIQSGLELQEQRRNQPLGEYLKSMVVLTSAELETALKRQRSMPQLKLGEVLLQENLINQQQLQDALAQQEKNRKVPLGEVLVSMGVVTQESIKQTLAKKLGIPFVDLRQFQIDPQALKLVPRELAQKHQIIPLYMYEGRVVFATENPLNWSAIDALRFVTKLNVDPVMATTADIVWAIDHHYGGTDDVGGLEEVELEVLTADDDNEPDPAAAKREGQEKPIVRFVNGLLLDAVRKRASDIHIRPQAKTVDLLFRIDGELVPMRGVNKQSLAPLVARLKILGNMNIAERRRPQDGRLRLKFADRIVDFRASVMPTVHGESVVLRVQDRSRSVKPLETIGFSLKDQGALIDMLHRNAGIVLVTGATGSGKSSTLYACLEKLVQRNLHVITVEDPVEAEIAGAEQIQVNNAAGYTFASALRNILRHDPDAIMVGEIRDHETAKIAMESAMTGHLVLSTLHTNDAPSTLTRLLEMEIEPFILGVSLLGVLSQRLVRLNCRDCLQPEAVAPDLATRLKLDGRTTFYKSTGCKACNGTGSAGRTLVYELLTVTPEIRQLINERRSAADLRDAACRQGMVRLADHALELAKNGQISLEQAYLVKQL